MTDIFLSYSSKDRDLVRPLVEVLEQHGWSVWWDQEIPTGRNFGKVIEKHLSDARCAIVAWTRNSVDSDWVRNEASDANARGALFPILLERGVKVPLEFRQVETRDLSDWRPGEAHPQFERLFRDLQQRMSGGASDASAMSSTQPTSVPAPRPRRSLWQTATGSWWYALTLLALPALFVGGVAWGLMQKKMPATQIELDLTLSRLRVQFLGPEPGARGWIVPVTTDALALRTLVVQNLKEAELEPACLSVVERGSSAQTCAPRAANSPHAVSLGAKPRRSASLLIEPIAASEQTTGKLQLQPLDVAAGTSVTFQSEPKQRQLLWIGVQSAAFTTHALGDGLLRLFPKDVVALGIDGAPADEDFALNVRTGNPSLLIRLVGAERGLRLRLERAAAEPVALLSATGASVSALHFDREDEQGRAVSALVEAGELRYVDLPAGNRITLPPHTPLKLDGLTNFAITQLKFDPSKGAYVLQARGGAAGLIASIGNAPADLRLSWFDRLWNDPKLRVLFTIITFVLGATPGIIKLASDSKRAQ